MYSDAECHEFCMRFHIRDDRHDRQFHFPPKSFLEEGYAPPGGYVKDFSIINHQGRYHLFHIDGRPEEVCVETGNEVSFGHASTSDFKHWIRHRMPLAVGDRPWENEHVWAPFVYKLGFNFYMFYMGAGKEKGPGGQIISYATSADLEKWIKWDKDPIIIAQGRDPFVFSHEQEYMLCYTKNNTISACMTADMQNWYPIPEVFRLPPKDTSHTESSSIHALKGKYVLWLNKARLNEEHFGCWYVFSDNPLHFEPDNLQEFSFLTDLNVSYSPGKDWIEKSPCPISLELVEKGKGNWLVAYFRWHINKFRLFFGKLDWSATPAAIIELNTPTQLHETIASLGR